MYEKTVIVTGTAGVEIPDKVYTTADTMPPASVITFLDNRTGKVFKLEAKDGLKWRM